MQNKRGRAAKLQEEMVFMITWFWCCCGELHIRVFGAHWRCLALSCWLLHKCTQLTSGTAKTPKIEHGSNRLPGIQKLSSSRGKMIPSET